MSSEHQLYKLWCLALLLLPIAYCPLPSNLEINQNLVELWNRCVA